MVGICDADLTMEVSRRVSTRHAECVRNKVARHNVGRDQRCKLKVYRAWSRRGGMVVINARSTAFTDSALLKNWATSGSSSTATEPFRIRPAKRFGLASA